MSTEQRDFIKQILQDAAALPREARQQFVESAIPNDPGLLAEALELLKTLDDSHFLNAPTVAAATIAAAVLHERSGTMVGRYKLLQVIGEGGFGTVFMAEQTEPVVRRVALKIIKAGMDTRQVIARFEAERQALAMMDHPNIARVLDGGATESGRPYFVMELVRGEPVTKFCDEMLLNVEQRLMLFRDVCSAVQHAHQKGVIHRDIKPSNVLVTVANGEPLVKVIDFGIAKATSTRLTDKTLFTEFHQLLGTPEYMSPEQADTSSTDVDTRTDVYSLGVLLYELLTGTTPFDARQLHEAGLDGLIRTIREDVPPRPSIRFANFDDSDFVRRQTPEPKAGRASSAQEIARRRSSEQRSLRHKLSGDLDWIVMKCVEKDRRRRYETAAALAQDVQRYLANEPVSATPPSAGYQIRKFIKRNRGAVMAALIVICTLLAGVFGTTYALIWALRERSFAVRESQNAHAAEMEQRRLAQAEARERRKSDAINAFVVKALETSDPVKGGKQSMLVSDAMLRAVDEIDAGAFRDDPATEANLLSTICSVLRNNGRAAESLILAERAVALLRTTHPGDHDDLGRAIGNLASSLVLLGRYAEAEQPSRDALDMFQRLHPQDNEDVANALGNMGEIMRGRGRVTEAESFATASLEMSGRLSIADSPELALRTSNLAVVRRMLGRHRDAEPLFREALAMNLRLFTGDHPQLADSMYEMASVASGLARPAEAEPLGEYALAMRRRLFAGDHPDVAQSLSLQAGIAATLGRNAEAVDQYCDALEMYQRLYPGDHPQVARALGNLSSTLINLRRNADAEPFAREALEMRMRMNPGDHPDVAQSLNTLAYLLQALSRFDEAEARFREALAMRSRMFPGDHPEKANTLHNLARLLRTAGRAQEAEQPARAALEMWQRIYQADHSNVALGLEGLAYVLQELNRPDEAEPLFRETLAMRRRLYPGDHSLVASSLAGLGAFLQGQGRYVEVEPLYREALVMRQRLYHGDHFEIAASLDNLAALYRQLRLPADAERLFRDSLAMRRRISAPDGFEFVQRLNNHALALCDLEAFAEAESIACESVTMCQRLFRSDHPLTANSLSILALTLHGSGLQAEAESQIEASADMIARVHAADHPRAKEIAARRRIIMGD